MTLENMGISFIIPGEPVGKGRARAFVRHGRVGHYTPEKTANYENLVKLAAAEAMKGRSPTDKPVALYVRAYLAIGASWSKKRQQAALQGLEYPTKKPDLDNIIKAIKDGCNGVVWKDDAQVVDSGASKRWTDRPHVEVRIVEVKA